MNIFFDNFLILIKQNCVFHPIKCSLYAITIIVILFFLKRIPQNSYFYAIITLPATIMHELSHLTVSIITFGKPTKINLIPKKTNTGIVYGYVESSNITKWNAAFIGLAPLILLFFGILFFVKYLVPEQHISLILIDFYTTLMLIEGGIPSKQDIKVALNSWPLIIIIGVIVFFLIKF